MQEHNLCTRWELWDRTSEVVILDVTRLGEGGLRVRKRESKRAKEWRVRVDA